MGTVRTRARGGLRLKFLRCLALFFACANAQAALSVTDDSGASVKLRAPAQRVVSLAPHVIELLFAVGGGSRVAGAVTYSDYPKEAQSIPRIGDNKALDLERIAALKPDLIVAWRHGSAERQMDRLKALGIPIFFYSEPKHLDDIASDIDKLGVLLGTQAKAHAVASAFTADIARLRAKYAQRPPSAYSIRSRTIR